MNNQANPNTDDRSASVLSDRLSVIRSWYTDESLEGQYRCRWCGSLASGPHTERCPVGMVGDLLARIDQMESAVMSDQQGAGAGSPERIADESEVNYTVRCYMAASMGMTEPYEDQEQNFILGHMATLLTEQREQQAAQLAQVQAERDEARHERDVERSRFAHYADKFGDLAYELERRAHSDWGHLRAFVLGTAREAVKQFRSFAAGQPSPSGYRVRAEKAESEVSALTAQVADLSARVETLQSEIYAAIEEMPACRRQHLLGAPLLAIVRETVSHMFYQQSRAEAAEKKLAAAEAEVARLRALSAWQPIETAPKDGTWVLLALIGNDGKVYRVSEGVFRKIGWYNYGGGSCHWRTHWMPLHASIPPVPASSQE